MQSWINAIWQENPKIPKVPINLNKNLYIY